MNKFIAIAQVDLEGGVPYCGPVAATVSEAAEGWYLHVCKTQGWGNESETFSGADHEQACDVYKSLQTLPPYTAIDFDFMGETISIAEVPS